MTTGGKNSIENTRNEFKLNYLCMRMILCENNTKKTFKFMRRTKVVDRKKCELIFNRFIGILFPLKFIFDLKVS